MKSLKTILSESILGKEGVTMFTDAPLIGDIYKALKKLPEPIQEEGGRFIYSTETGAKFCKTILPAIRKETKRTNVRAQKWIRQYKSAPGIAFNISNLNNATDFIIILWDGSQYLIARCEEYLLQKDWGTDNTGMYWTVVIEAQGKWWSYLDEAMEVANDWWYFPINPNMNIIKHLIKWQ